MSIKVSTYFPESEVCTDSSNRTTITDISGGESFENILVLNRTALKAMTIDHMVANSKTGSVNPDSVDAAAIMKFRSTLKNVDSPVPVDEPVTVPKVYTPANTISTTPKAASPVNTPSAASDLLYTTGSAAGDALLNKLLETIDTDKVYNEGILTCSNTLNVYFEAASEKYGVDVKLLKAMAKAESDFDPACTSKSGAMGIMQLMPATAQYYGVTNPYDPYQNIMGGAHLMADNLSRFNGDISLAVAAYNCGGNRVEEAGGIPDIEQTQKYVANVLKYYNSEQHNIKQT